MTPRWLGPLVLLACAPHEHPREPQRECAAGMVVVEGSLQGSPAIDRLCVDATEVTTAAYGACVHAGACTPTVVGDVAECNLTRADRGEHPINCVEFEQARAYCSWLGKRLPSDAEWAHIARPRLAGAAWVWGTAAIDATRACIHQSGTCPVGQHPAGASVDGVHDLVGGVAEWVVHGERQRLRGGSWRAAPGPPFSEESTDSMAAADSGVRCVVAPFSTVTAPDLEAWTPLTAGQAELPVLAAPSPPFVPPRPLANLQLLRGDPQRHDAARWWPVGDDWLTGYDGGQPDVLGLPDVLERASLPEGLREFTPVRQLGSDLLLMRGGWASSLRFVAVERSGFKIRWQIPFANYGSSFEQFVGPRTLVAEIYGQQGDAIVGFGLADGRELWRIAGGEQGPFVRASRVWTDGDRGYVRGDRGLLAFDLVTGQVLWDGVTLDDDCGVVAGDGVMVVEGPEPEGHRRLDAATGAELGRLEGSGGRCVWGVHPNEGGVVPAVLEDSRLFSLTVPDGRGITVLRVHDITSGRELWRRGGFAPHVLVADREAVYVRLGRDLLIGLEAATGAPQIEISLAGEFALSLLAGGGPRGPLLLSFGEVGNDWLLGRGEQPSAPEAYTVRGRLVPDGLSRSSVAGVPVRVGDKRTRTDAAGRFTLKGVARGAVAVALGNDKGPGEPGGSTVRFEPVTVVLAGRGTYEVGDVPLYAWYTE